MRITGNDQEGVEQLDNFIDPEATFPVIVTTSRLLSTGVDVQTCRVIVLDREVGSMTEFKQIVGRGTRVHEDTKQVLLHADRLPEGDEPLRRSRTSTASRCRSTSPDRTIRSRRQRRTAAGRWRADSADARRTTRRHRRRPARTMDRATTTTRRIARSTSTASRSASSPSASSTSTPTASWSPRASATSAEETLRKRFASLDDFLSRWKAAERKQAIIDELDDEGLPLEALAEEVGTDLDPFDLICHVAFDQPPLTRRERAENVRKRDVFTKYGPQARAVLEALLAEVPGRRRHEPRRSAHPSDPAVRRDGHAGAADPAVREPRATSSTPSTNCSPRFYEGVA